MRSWYHDGGMSAEEHPPSSASAADTSAAGSETEAGMSHTVWCAPFVVVALAYIFQRGANVVFGPAKEDIASELGTSLDAIMGTRTTTSLLSAVIVIPCAILVTRLSAGSIAWVGVMLYGVGFVISGVSPDLWLFYVGAIIGAIGAILMIPLLGQVGRDHLTIRTFVVATTIVVVLGRAIQAVSLSLTQLVYESIGWRALYIGWGVVMLPIMILALRYIKKEPPSQDVSSIGKSFALLWWMLKQPLVWACGLSFGLTMATVGNFGFIWNINLQEALGWSSFDANVLTFLFVIGGIFGGYLVTLLSKWIEEYPAILISMGGGIILFSICVFATSSLREFWLSSFMLFFVGVALGGGTMIQPHVSRYFEKQTTAMFFGVTTAMFVGLTGIIISTPLWTLPDTTTWTVANVREALVPYALMIAAGIVLFASTRWIPKREQKEDESE